MKKLKAACWLMCTLLVVATSCKVETDSNMDVEKVKQEIKDRKIRKITDAELLVEASDRGKTVVALFLEQQPLSQNACGTDNWLPKEAEEGELGELLERVVVYCKAAPGFGQKERQIWEAYQYNTENGLELQPNIQKLADGEQLLYTHPFSYQNTAGGNSLGVLAVYFSKKDVIRFM